MARCSRVSSTVIAAFFAIIPHIEHVFPFKHAQMGDDAVFPFFALVTVTDKHGWSIHFFRRVLALHFCLLPFYF